MAATVGPYIRLSNTIYMIIYIYSWLAVAVKPRNNNNSQSNFKTIFISHAAVAAEIDQINLAILYL